MSKLLTARDDEENSGMSTVKFLKNIAICSGSFTSPSS